MFDRSNRGQISFEDFGALWKYVTDWQACFHSFDLDQSGNIDRQEFKLALHNFGYRISDNLINIMVKKFDRYGNGTILFDDFIQACVVLHVSIDEVFRRYIKIQENITYNSTSKKFQNFNILLPEKGHMNIEAFENRSIADVKYQLVILHHRFLLRVYLKNIFIKLKSYYHIFVWESMQHLGLKANLTFV